MSRSVCAAVCAVFLTFVVEPGAHSQSSDDGNGVIIHASKPYTQLVSDIEKLGGKVKWQYEYVDAIAADVPANMLSALRGLVGEDAITKDSIVAAPKPVLLRNAHKSVLTASDSDIYTSVPVGPATRIFPVPTLAQMPSERSYGVNYANLKIRQLHSRGYTGRDIVVAVVDSGVRPGYPGLDSDGSIIGGEDFVGDGLSYSSPRNDPHGTFVSTLISGNAKFSVPPTDGVFITSMDTNFAGALETDSSGRSLPVIGSAPEASIYMLRIFGVGTFSGAPKSRLIAALERVIKLRENFDKFGRYSAANPRGGFNIKVCNLSAGTSTIFAGHTPLEQLIDKMLEKDIVPVVAAGDAGPSSLTISSPATAFGSLAVGATSPAANDRLLNDLIADAAGFGVLFRPTGHTQTSFFSSRGPTADGRLLPDVAADGVGVISQGCGGLDSTGTCRNDPRNVDLADGTSFSAPIVAGLAAILRQEFPNASSTQIRNAIVTTADNRQLGDGSTVLDQGHGVVNAVAAETALRTGRVSDDFENEGEPDSLVRNNIEENTGLRVEHGAVRQSFKDLKPGERREVLYEVPDATSEVVIDVGNIRLSGPQNVLFGDDVFVSIHSAKTSSGAFGDYFQSFSPFVVADTSITIKAPEPGILRITLMGDFINAGLVSADVRVTSSKDPLQTPSLEGTIRGGDNIFFPVPMPSGISEARFELQWNGNWGRYPTNDLDMYLHDPAGNIDRRGATLNDPERVTVRRPIPGTWYVQVQGFAVSTKKDEFELRVVLDGRPLKLNTERQEQER